MSIETSSVAAAIFISALLHLRAEYNGPRWQVYLFKPLTTTLILLLALTVPDAASPVYRTLIALGLLFSLGGDVFLMLPRDRFLWGLVSFLIAHLCYTAAFLSRSGPGLTPLLLLPYLTFGALMLWRLWPHIGALRLPVLIYMAVILVMGWQAAEAWWALRSRSALLAAVGAAFFVLSDAVLARDRFAAPFRSARAVVLSTYYLAQWLIALSV